MDKLLSATQLATFLNLKPVTIRRKAKKGEIPSIRIGNRLRFDKEQVDEWLQYSSNRKLVQILVVDDEPMIGQLFEKSLRKHDCQVMVSSSSLEALEILDKKRFDLIFLDLFMPELDGAELFRRIRQKNNRTPVAIITGYPDSDLMRKAMTYGPFVVLEKPFYSDDILDTIFSFTYKSAK